MDEKIAREKFHASQRWHRDVQAHSHGLHTQSNTRTGERISLQEVSQPSATDRNSSCAPVDRTASEGRVSDADVHAIQPRRLDLVSEPSHEMEEGPQSTKYEIETDRINGQTGTARLKDRPWLDLAFSLASIYRIWIVHYVCARLKHM